MTVIPWIERVNTTCMHFAAIGAQRQIFSNFQVIAVHRYLARVPLLREERLKRTWLEVAEEPKPDFGFTDYCAPPDALHGMVADRD